MKFFRNKKERSGIAGIGWLAAGGFLVLAALAALYFVFRGGSAVPGAAIVSESARDVFRSQEKGQIYEINLDAADGKGASSASEVKNSTTSEAEKNGDDIKITQTSPKNFAAPTEKPAPSVPPRLCEFGAGANPSRTLAFNEIAWMGTSRSADNEWIEIKNNGSGPYSAERVQLLSDSGKIKIILGVSAIPAHDFYLLERTDDDTVPGIAADAIYTGSLSNSGEHLKLFDANCGLLDEVNALSGWGTFGGDNATKNTAERNLKDLAWHTSVSADGTPRAENSKEPDPPPQSTAQNSPAPSANPPPEPTPPPSSSPENLPPPANSSSTTPVPSPPPPAGGPVISEILAGISADADYEFIELYNSTDAPIDLTGWSIKRKSSTGNEYSLLVASRLSGKIIPPKSYFLAVNEGKYTGSVSPDVSWATSNKLAYTNNAVILYDATGAKVEEVGWAETPLKDQSYERDLASGTFSVQANPNPRNSQGGN